MTASISPPCTLKLATITSMNPPPPPFNLSPILPSLGFTEPRDPAGKSKIGFHDYNLLNIFCSEIGIRPL